MYLVCPLTIWVLLIVTDSSYTRFICSLDKLLELLEPKCHTTGCYRSCSFTHRFVGCSLSITGLCGAGHAFAWVSSHIETPNTEVDNSSRRGGRIFTDNMEVTSSLVVSGNT